MEFCDLCKPGILITYFTMFGIHLFACWFVVFLISEGEIKVAPDAKYELQSGAFLGIE